MLAAVFLIGEALEALDTRPSVFPVRKGKIMLTLIDSVDWGILSRYSRAELSERTAGVGSWSDV